jgi:hypothetical protein
MCAPTRLLLLSLLLAIAGGCGNPPPRLYPVKGKVLLDGKPLEAGKIVFFSHKEAPLSERLLTGNTRATLTPERTRWRSGRSAVSPSPCRRRE